AIAVLAFAVGHDLASQPRDRFGVRAAVAAIDQYRARVSPRIARFTQCRFRPSCSAYGREAIQKYGLLSGAGKTAGRIARCGPWTKVGTVDAP
ncbi:MAG: membrane protein insertion efficiency factor YidD, partial [Thermoanaerobaculia bacterium]